MGEAFVDIRPDKATASSSIRVKAEAAAKAKPALASFVSLAEPAAAGPDGSAAAARLGRP